MAAGARRSSTNVSHSWHCGQRHSIASAEAAVFYRDPHLCRSCRYRADAMLWRCPQCHEWDTFVEERLAPAATAR